RRIALHGCDKIRNQVRAALIIRLQIAPGGIHLLLRGGNAVEPAACKAQGCERREKAETTKQVHLLSPLGRRRRIGRGTAVRLQYAVLQQQHSCCCCTDCISAVCRREQEGCHAERLSRIHRQRERARPRG